VSCCCWPELLAVLRSVSSIPCAGRVRRSAPIPTSFSSLLCSSLPLHAASEPLHAAYGPLYAADGPTRRPGPAQECWWGNYRRRSRIAARGNSSTCASRADSNGESFCGLTECLFDVVSSGRRSSVKDSFSSSSSS